MDDEAPPTGGLDARGGQRGPRWGRRTPYGLRRDSRGDGWHEPADGRSDATYAALDLGTNNCRLLIARPAGDGFRVVDAFSRIIRLGEGVAASRRISEAAMTRAVEALQVCRDKMQRARRHARAADRHRGLPRRRERRGVPRPRRRGGRPRARDRRSATEARLAATGCTELFDPAASGVILFDIGGGSSELVRLGRAGRAAGAGRRSRTSSAGRRCRSASSRSPSATAAPWFRRRLYDAMVDEVAGFVERFADAPSRTMPRRLSHARHLGHGDDDRRRVLAPASATTAAGSTAAGCPDQEISRVVGELMAMSFDERAANPVHRRRARRPRARRLRHPRRHPPLLSVPAAARRRSRPARGHAGRDDARGRRLGRGLTGHG